MAFVTYCRGGEHKRMVINAWPCWSPALHCQCGSGYLPTVLVDATEPICHCGRDWGDGPRHEAACAFLRLIQMTEPGWWPQDEAQRLELITRIADILALPEVPR